MITQVRNKGEGERESARRDNKDGRETVRTTDIDEMAEEAGKSKARS